MSTMHFQVGSEKSTKERWERPGPVPAIAFSLMLIKKKGNTASSPWLEFREKKKNQSIVRDRGMEGLRRQIAKDQFYYPLKGVWRGKWNIL